LIQLTGKNTTPHTVDDAGVSIKGQLKDTKATSITASLNCFWSAVKPSCGIPAEEVKYNSRNKDNRWVFGSNFHTKL
jgi:hypothetical protein